MRLAVLFSGGKDSTFAAFLAKNHGHEISCLVSVYSKNPFSYMFHTPSIKSVREQAAAMNTPLIEQETEGVEKEELNDLRNAIIKARQQHSIDGVVTGALASAYQASRIQSICNELDLEVFNPLWQKDQIEFLNDLLKNNFEVIITGVAAYPLDQSWLGRRIDHAFVEDVIKLDEKYKINPAGEGGEFETFVLNCPLFSKKLELKDSRISGSGNNYRMEVLL